MNRLTAKLYPGHDPKWTIAECVELPCVTQGRTHAHAIERLKECTKLWLEVVAEDEPDIYERNGLDASLMEDLAFTVETEIRHKKSGNCQATHADIKLELFIRLCRLLNYGDEASEEVEEDRARYKTLAALLDRDEVDLPTLRELGIEDAYY